MLNMFRNGTEIVLERIMNWVFPVDTLQGMWDDEEEYI